jgi:hypothetical protein
MLFPFCQSALALSVAIWVCSFFKAAAVPNSSALLMMAYYIGPGEIANSLLRGSNETES